MEEPRAEAVARWGAGAGERSGCRLGGGRGGFLCYFCSCCTKVSLASQKETLGMAEGQNEVF